ncbi:MAG TPA: N-acetylmuramoyl-L-alanine amidase [Coriobacteriia bacterium]
MRLSASMLAARVAVGASIVLAFAAAAVAVALPASPQLAAPAAAARVSAATKKTFVVVIDAGHQAKADTRTEPIGPGSKKRKARVAGGASGVATHRPESLDNLQVALKLRADLIARGVKVVMIRTVQKVDISNATRARTANAANADLFIHLHCDGSTSHSMHGILTLVPASNSWTKKILTASARAGRDIQAGVLAATHAKDRGITKRGDLSGFNWSKVPTALVEMGLMSNAAEDRSLASPAYQDKLAAGIADGIMTFLGGK